MGRQPGLEGQRIAVLRALYIGDLITAVPAWRALRRSFPQAEITLIGLPWAQEIVRRYPYLDRLVEFPGFPGMPEVELDPVRLADFQAEARRYRYDLALQMHGSGEQSAVFVATMGAKLTAGYEPQGRCHSWLDLSLPYPEGIPEVYRNLRLVQKVVDGRGDLGPAARFMPERIGAGMGAQPTMLPARGGPSGSLLRLPLPRLDLSPGRRHGEEGWGEASLEFPILPEDEAELLAIPGISQLRSGAPIIGIHPGSNYPARCWPPERFAAVGRKLARVAGGQVVVTGGPAEVETAGQVVQLMEDRTINLAGKTTLGALAALISRMALFISNDTGPAHIAAALGTPAVTLYGPASPARWSAPSPARQWALYRPVECSPCPHRVCPTDHRCLRAIGVDDVLAAATEMMQEVTAA